MNARKSPKPGCPSGRSYRDYVIRDGKYIGRFEEMYQKSADVPWHQDETVDAIFSQLTVTILKHRKITSMLDVGCGLGYMTDRLRREIPELTRVLGLDIAPTAIEKATHLFPEVEFRTGTIESLPVGELFEAVVSKDVLWYVLDDLARYVSELVRRSSRWVYIGQSFPERKPFLGDAILPNAESLFELLTSGGHSLAYTLVERDADYGGREYAHALIEVIYDRTA